MTIPEYDFVWQQGEDGLINITYSIDGVPVNLTGYKLRMDIRSTATGTILYTFNSDDIVETPSVDVTGASDNEATLTSGGAINIVVPRTASLTGGTLANNIGESLAYDIFLRDTANKQRKILKGTVTIEASITRWT
jgi:hypothetical protein